MSAVLGPAQSAQGAPTRRAPAGAPATRSAPCELEANRTGLWHKVLEFDLASEAETHYVQTGAESLGLVDASVAFRIVTRGPQRNVLQNYSARHGWTPA